MTGTAAGDPVEAEAIARTFGKSREAHDPIVVGSIKKNVGHPKPVSGLAAIIKTTFALKNRLIPPNLNFEIPNPQIDLQGWHLKVPTTPVPWPQDKLLRASVNNFGYGGTNSHLILEPLQRRLPRGIVLMDMPMATMESTAAKLMAMESSMDPAMESTMATDTPMSINRVFSS